MEPGCADQYYGGSDMSLFEVLETVGGATGSSSRGADHLGAVIDEHMDDALRVTVIATGYSDVALEEPAKAVPAYGGAARCDEQWLYRARRVRHRIEVHEKFDPDATPAGKRL
jgi:cell division GTPase FtsZ